MTIIKKAISPKEAFNNGYTCFSKKDYQNARDWYNISAQDPKYCNQSLARLTLISLKEENYAQARDILENSDTKDPLLKRVYGLLERVELNFDRSRKYFSECMAEPKYPYSSFLYLAKLHVQMGDYDMAEKMFQTLQLNAKFYFQATLDLIYLYSLQTKFYDAKQNLMTINVSTLDERQLGAYLILEAYLKYFLGELKSSDSEKSCSYYVINYLYNHNDNNLLSHINRHKSSSINGMCFYPDLDLPKLLMEVRSKIENMNGNHFEICDIYKFSLDYPIGFKDNEVTYDLCVATLLGTKDIITMYPIILSKDYNKEGLLTSEELKLKRILGGKR